MKKFFIIMTAAALAFTGCKEDNIKIDESPKGEISVAPDKKTFSPEGGSQPVVVTSSGDWTLEAPKDCKWITPDLTQGQDGDIVTFKVEPNNSGEELTAVFTFRTGDAEATFTAISQMTDPASLTLVSAPELEIAHSATRINVEVETNLSYRSLKPSFSEEGWITFNAPEKTEKGAILHFDVKALEGMDSRETVITIADENEGCEPVKVTVKQRAMPVITPEKISYYISLEATSLEIPVTTNVEYDLAVEGDWLTYVGNEEGVLKFTMSAATEKREATITMTEKSPLEGVEPVVVTVLVVQKDGALVTSAINMANARLFPDTWKNADPLNGLNTLTIEALVRPDTFDKGGSGTLSTIMGIEGKCLVRVGDASIPSNQLQLIIGDQYSQLYSYDYTDERARLEPGKWYHIAVTFINKVALFAYINGELVIEGHGASLQSPINLGIDRSGETGPNPVRGFWVGYSYDPGRDFKGLMTELRIWNRALSQEEINTENHFYTVDPNSDGLVAYWKCDEGSGLEVKDHTSNENHLIGQTNVRQDHDEYGYSFITGDEGINWVEVSLPE